MKEYILDEENEGLEVNPKESKPKSNINNIVKALAISDIVSFILFFIFIFLSKILLWLFLILTFILSLFLIISIFYKIKKDREEREEREKEEEERKAKEEELKIKKEEERKRKEQEKINDLKRKLLEKQNKLKESSQPIDFDQLTDEQKNEEINEVLEDMCIYGNIIKKEIKEEKEKNPEKFIETSKALQLENEDSGLFALGLISQNLEEIGVETAIEKEENTQNEDSQSSLQFIANGMCEKKKYDLHFEFGKERNEELLDNEEEYKNFKENLKLKLSKDYNIPEDKIVITFPQKGSFHVQVIFQSDEFNNLDTNNFMNKFQNDGEFKELCHLKEIHSDVIMGGCKLLQKDLDPRGNRSTGWGVGENRGGIPYNPPIGWTGIGLKVMDKYGDNTWLGMNNSYGEWCVAYHGVARGCSSDKVKYATGNIYKGEKFFVGQNQVHKDCYDIFHPGKTVGNGVYCTPNITTAESYAGYSDINGKRYATVLMVRVNPKAIRHCSDSGDYWVVDGTTNQIRPYIILYKKC